jgi:hypothetical protein
LSAKPGKEQNIINSIMEKHKKLLIMLLYRLRTRKCVPLEPFFQNSIGDFSQCNKLNVKGIKKKLK